MVTRATKQADASPSARLERFTAELDAIYQREKAAQGAEDCREMRKRVRLSRFCRSRGRELIGRAKGPTEFARGVWMLASHYIMEVTNGHAITHGIYDNLPNNHGLKSDEYEWANTTVVKDWAVDHNEIHHPFTNVVGTDHDFGFNLFRLSGKQPWRPYHLLQVPVVFIGMPLALTWYFPTFLAVARAKHEKRAVASRRTFGPVARKVLAHWWRGYVTEPRKAGLRFPQAAFGNACAQLIANTYVLFMLGVEHHCDNLLEFDPDPDEPRELNYLRQIMGSKNFHTREEHEDLYTLGVNIHVEHHLFPDLSITRLRRVESEVQALCERFGIPHTSERWGTSAWRLAKSILRFSLPVKDTKARVSRRTIFDALADELREARAERETTSPVPVAETYTIRLSRSGRAIDASGNATLLESLERAGVEVAFGCRKGACKTCVTRKLSGRTTLERQREKDTVELCIARPVTDVELDL